MLLMLAAPLAGLAQSGVPDLSHCLTWMNYDGPEILTLMVVPDGSGPQFTAALLPDGTTVDATIYLQVIDWFDVPVPMFPWEDMWLESEDGELVPCIGGTCADEDTDAAGMTQWIEPLAAGGYSQALTGVLVNGENVTWDGGLPLNFNSPDNNGDLQVTIADVGWFATDFFGNYHFRSDLFRDGTINLADYGRMVQGLGANCP